MFEESKTSIEDVCGKGVKFSERVINIDSDKKIESNVETDEQFVEDLIAIAEHSRAQDKEIFAKRVKLTEDQYRFVEETGEVHYEANLFNENFLKNSSQIKE